MKNALHLIIMSPLIAVFFCLGMFAIFLDWLWTD
jgi:hypothetical protein